MAGGVRGLQHPRWQEMVPLVTPLTDGDATSLLLASLASVSLNQISSEMVENQQDQQDQQPHLSNT